MNALQLNAAAAKPQNAPTPRQAAVKKKILIVDDNSVIRKTTSFKLASAGYEPVTAADASEAISALREQRPELILLDLSFPPDVANGGRMTWDGFQLMSWLKREGTNVPFIVITSSDASVKEAAMGSGASAFFQKPLKFPELLPKMQAILTGPTAQTT